MNISPFFTPYLHERFTQDMTLRKLHSSTQVGYLRAVNKLCDYLMHSPETATDEELRLFQLFMVTQGDPPKLRAIPFPIPRLAPVTSATLSCRGFIQFSV